MQVGILDAEPAPSRWPFMPSNPSSPTKVCRPSSAVIRGCDFGCTRFASERVEVKLCPRARVKLSLCSDQYVLAEEPSGVLLKRTERGER
jgi:hypothetical protein